MKTNSKSINYKKLVRANKKLAMHLDILLNDKRGLIKTLHQIEYSKAYRLIHYLSNIRESILSKFYKHDIHSADIVKTEFEYRSKHSPISELISVVIPTRNGGEDFKKNLTTIMNQSDIPNMEILILDNNSTDGTREFAIEKGCRVFPIKENEFGHGKTRAFGANEALGKYIIFTVQDASLSDKFVYSNLINFVKENNLSIASGCQKPNPTADSFAMWQNQYHYHVMNPQNASIIYDATLLDPLEYQKLDFLSKRKIICIDDVIACYKREVFENFNFSEDINFAEDAYLAQLTLLDKKKIGITSSAVVFHSHNVKPIYAFKRAYVDTISLKHIFNQDLNRFFTKPTQLKSQLSTIFLLASTLCTQTSTPKSFSTMLKQTTHFKMDKTNPLLNSLLKLQPKINLTTVTLDQELIQSLSRNTESIFEDYSGYCSKIGKTLYFEKFMANILGSYLAEIALNYKDSDIKFKIESVLDQRV